MSRDSDTKPKPKKLGKKLKQLDKEEKALFDELIRGLEVRKPGMPTAPKWVES